MPPLLLAPKIDYPQLPPTFKQGLIYLKHLTANGYREFWAIFSRTIMKHYISYLLFALVWFTFLTKEQSAFAQVAET
jgi:hypothetical protein